MLSNCNYVTLCSAFVLYVIKIKKKDSQIGNFLSGIGIKNHNFWHWEWGRISAPKSGYREPSPSIRYMQPAKPQISLRIRTVWSEPLLVASIFYVTEHHFEFLILKGGCTCSSLVYSCQKCQIARIHVSLLICLLICIFLQSHCECLSGYTEFVPGHGCRLIDVCATKGSQCHPKATCKTTSPFNMMYGNCSKSLNIFFVNVEWYTVISCLFVVLSKLLPQSAVDGLMHYCIRSSTVPRVNSLTILQTGMK